MQLSKYQQDELDHLVEMAKQDKREAWHAALERAKSPLLADMPRLLTERMNALKQSDPKAFLKTADWDREQLEKGEARMLARAFKDEQWLMKALKVSERTYGKGSGERIRAHMETIFREELLKC